MILISGKSYIIFFQIGLDLFEDLSEIIQMSPNL